MKRGEVTRHGLSRSHSAPQGPECQPATPTRAGSACVGKCNRDYRKALAADPANVRAPRPGRPVWCVDEYATNPTGELHRTHTGCTTLIGDDLARNNLTGRPRDRGRHTCRRPARRPLDPGARRGRAHARADRRARAPFSDVAAMASISSIGAGPAVASVAAMTIA